MTYDLKTLSRGLDVLLWIAEQGPATLSEVSGEFNLNRTTALRTIRTLEDYAFVRRDQRTRMYSVGLRAIYLASHAGDATVAAELRPHLREVSDDFEATVHLGLKQDASVIVIDKLEPANAIVHYSIVGSEMPLHCTGMGKAILAMMDDEQLGSLLQGKLERYTPSTVVDMGTLRRELSATRDRGFAVDRGEYQTGFECVAVALRVAGDCYAISIANALGVSANEERRGARLLELRTVLLDRLDSIAVLRRQRRCTEEGRWHDVDLAPHASHKEARLSLGDLVGPNPDDGLSQEGMA